MLNGTRKEAVLVCFGPGRVVDVLAWSLTTGDWSVGVVGDWDKLLWDGNREFMRVDLEQHGKTCKTVLLS